MALVYYRVYFEKWKQISAGLFVWSRASLTHRLRWITVSFAFRSVQLLVNLSLNLLRFDSAIVDVWFAVERFYFLFFVGRLWKQNKKLPRDNSNLFIVVSNRKKNTIEWLEKRRNRPVHQHSRIVRNFCFSPGELHSAHRNVEIQIKVDFERNPFLVETGRHTLIRSFFLNVYIGITHR